MLIIRLSRVGKKGQPFFRLIINEKAKDTQGSYLEILGSYNPRSKGLVLKEERIKYWLSKGAQASPTVHNLLVDHKLVVGPKRSATSTKKKEGEEKSASAPKPSETPKAA
ncbi:MAG: 30S ribosomal protein S16 [bacterium]|nr:30S ribosomal protein S16 [bacterium]